MSVGEDNGGQVSVEEARAAMRRAFEADPEPGGLYFAYVANIAMLLSDNYGISDPETRESAAKDILDLVFNRDA